MSNFDIVIVGAGNAGLSAAIRCVLAGKKTLLIEQHNLPGGCATSFRRGRFEFEPSLHELCGIGTPDSKGDLGKLFDYYGVDIEWIELQECFRVVSKFSDGTPLDVTLPQGKEPFIKAMEDYVPGCGEKVREYFELIEETEKGLAYVSDAANRNVKVIMEKFPNMLRTGAYSFNKVMRAMKMPQKAAEILGTYWSYLGVDLEHLSFAHYGVMFNSYVSRSAHIPAHTSHDISNRLLERYRELGGNVWFNCTAEKILFKGEHVRGVRTTSGEVSCNYVLANVNPEIVYGKMIPKRLIPERIKKIVSAREHKFSGRMLTTYIGLDCEPEELGIKNYSVFLASSMDSVKEYNDMHKSLDDNNYAVFNCLSVVNPNASPKGTSICSFTTFCGADEWNDVCDEEYDKLKVKIAKKFILALKEKTGVDLTGHIEEIAVATPWTFARYIGSPEGSCYGYEIGGWDGMLGRSMMVNDDYPVKGLKAIGAAGARGVGYNSAYICGKNMAELAIRELSSKGGANNAT